MAKWQSKAEIEEQEFQGLYRKVYPQIETAMQHYVASYDESQPVEDDMKTLANSPLALLRRRMAKYCVWPLVRQIGGTVSVQGRLVSMSIERFAKPMQEAYDAQKRAEEKAKRDTFKAAAQNRIVVEEGFYRKGFNAGEFVRFPEQNRILVCLSCEFIRAPQDIGQDDDSYACTFAEATTEEQATEAYQRGLKAMQDDLAYESRKKAELEEHRNAELAAIRASGREPDYMDEFFAGTGDN